ncbi:MAG: metallophosphoesterase, partial [Myxococcota bacterium]|nr:metallophosphoesterase [Myxococcota bacterium]
TSGRVKYGTAVDNQSTVVDDTVTDNHHAVLLSNLNANTRYYYSVGTNISYWYFGSDEEAYHFVTAPTVGSETGFSAWVVGDSGTGQSAQTDVRDAMLAAMGNAKPDLFVHLGDMAYESGTTSEFTNNFFTPYADILRNTVVWPTMGNREGTSSDSSAQSGPYYDAFTLPTAAEMGGVASGTEAYYSYNYANAHFVVLDSAESSRSATGAMHTWLAQDLEANTQEWLIAYWHHPPYSKGTHDSDSETALTQMRENFLPLLEEHGVDVVFSGHSHLYERSYLVHGAYDTPTTAGAHILDNGSGNPQSGDAPYVKAAGDSVAGTLYVVAGHGGASLGGDADHALMAVSEKEHGSLVIDIHGNGLRLRNIRKDQEISDEAILIKGSGFVWTTPGAYEEIVAGTSYALTWVSAGSQSTVNIQFSSNNGGSWSNIASGVENNGSYLWTVPSLSSDTCLLRISDTLSSKTSARTFSVLTDGTSGDDDDDDDNDDDDDTDCVTCAAGYPECPECGATEVCQIVSQTCEACASARCIENESCIECPSTAPTCSDCVTGSTCQVLPRTCTTCELATCVLSGEIDTTPPRKKPGFFGCQSHGGASVLFLWLLLLPIALWRFRRGFILDKGSQI